MKPSTAAPIVAAPATANENQFWAHADKDGYIVGGSCTRQKPDGLGFLGFLREMRDRYPLSHSDIVMPPGWELNEDGSARRVTQMYAAGTLVACLTTEDIELPQPVIAPDFPVAPETLSPPPQ